MTSATQLPVETAWDSIRVELKLLNARLRREVERRRPRGRVNEHDQLPGLVLHEEEVLRVLDSEQPSGEVPEIDEEARTAAAQLFQLTRAEEQCLLLCLACEIHPEFSKVLAYLHDDVTRRLPSVGLAIELFWGRDRFPEGRSCFLSTASLLRNRLVEIGDQGGAFSHRTLRLDERVAGLLLDSTEMDGALSGWGDLWTPTGEPVRTPVPLEIRERTLRLAESCFAKGEADVRPVIHLYGRAGSGRQSLAKFVCQQLGLPLLIADVRRMPSGQGSDRLWRLSREALLQPAAVYLAHFDDLLEGSRREEMEAFLEASSRYSPLTFLSGAKSWNAPLAVKQRLYVDLECASPGAGERVELWSERLGKLPHTLADNEIQELAGEFHFTDGQIKEALLGARGRSIWEGEPSSPLTASSVQGSCRGQATPHLGDLARKVEVTGSWDDLVLPGPQKQQLREIVSHVKRSQMVMGKWGFGGRLASGCGVAVLFEGTSGTGKTTAAGIIAAELGLDLYKIDLAGVVNKYIGETEKNLTRIFDEARDSNTILFFDEAEALFAKRAEMVKDANDRYAGIETAHLLQRLEGHDGVVILATNMKQNLDEAFVRRLRFILHFPFPSDEDREQIWQRVFPATAPIAKDLDFRWLARRLRFTGAQIKNISLRAAFLAVDRGSEIDMACILDAAGREMEKVGKAYNPADYCVPAQRSVQPAAGAVV